MAANLPETMTAMGFDEAGGPEVLRPETLPVPVPGANQILIRVAYAGVNRPDVIQRQGFYPPPPGASPMVMTSAFGSDFSPLPSPSRKPMAIMWRSITPPIAARIEGT